VAGDRWVKEKAETERAAFDAIAQAARKRHREEPK
jgi:hypothetical protein